jgi:hypothetical protein
MASMRFRGGRLKPPKGRRPVGSALAGLPPFVPQNPVEALMVRAADDPALTPELEKALLSGDLYAATPEAPPPGEQVCRTARPQESIVIMPGPSPAGLPVPAVFTSARRIADAFGPGRGFFKANGAQLLRLFAERGAVLNPACEYGRYWGPDELAQLLRKVD